jgi:outer membrane protein assembly factor BamB
MWSQASFNRGGTGLAAPVSGIPAGRPRWEIRQSSKYGLDWDICMTAGAIFGNSAKREVVAIAADGGEFLWRTDLPEKATSGMALEEGFVAVAPFVLEQGTGKVVYGEERERNAARGGKASQVVVTSGGFLWPIVEPQPGIELFYPGRSAEKFDFPVPSIYSSEDQGLVYGRLAHELTCYALEEHAVRWRLPLPLARDGRPMKPSGPGAMFLGGRVYLHLNFNTLWCMDAINGQFVWKSGPDTIEANGTPYEPNAPSRTLMADDIIYLVKQIDEKGEIHAHAAADGTHLWTRPAPKARVTVVAGDLLLGVSNDVPTAWDRYSGEVVWTSDKPMQGTMHAIAAGTKIVYTNSTGQMWCYEWSDPYESSYK